MKLIIHRGTNEIGGSCVEFNNGCKRIVFDVGLPLNAIDEGLDISCYKPNISGLFGEESGVAAIFISHAHPDHYGLLSLINKNIPFEESCAVVRQRKLCGFEYKRNIRWRRSENR